jgi:uncharacterized protein (TIGR02118 family)
LVKVVSLFKRRSDRSVEAFQAYWRSRHSDEVVKLPGLRRYVQSHTLIAGYTKGEPVYDGIAELWFDDTAAMRASAATPEYARVRADEANFLAPGPAPFIITREHVIVA